MLRTLSYVESGWLYQPMTSAAPIVVESPAWFDWLERHNAFTFVDPVGSFTAYKSTPHPDGSSWETSLTRGSRRFSVWLGPAHALTLERLQSAVRTLAAQHDPGEPPEAAPDEYFSPRTTARPGLPGALLQTKLARPRLPSDVIPRPRLLERLSAGLGGPLTLLCAPAGYGKSTLLAQWLPTLSRPVAWLSLDEADDELPVFVHGFSVALQRVVPDACQASASLLHAPQFPPLSEVVSLLMSDLDDVPGDVLLVLDDYHLIQQSEIHTLVVQLIEHLPQPLHLVLSSRTEPPLPLARWRARGQLQDLRAADLRFTLEETHAFLARLLGDEAACETAGALVEQTEGWAAALRLVTLSLRNTADWEAFLERLGHAPDRHLSGYLVEEVLAQLAPAAQEVLMRLSLLEPFCAEVGTATLGGEVTVEQMQALLDEWERTNLFVVPLDERQGWYRYHHMFRAVLQRRLQARVSPEEIATLHRRASGWYTGQGLVDEALRHALAAGDSSAAAQLVEAQFLWALEKDQRTPMERWLRLLPEEQIQNSPGLLLARAWVLQTHGQLEDYPRLLTNTEQLLGVSERGVRDQDDTQSRLQSALIAIGWSHFQYHAGQAQASLESAQAALEWTPPGEEYVAAVALAVLAISRQATGQEAVTIAELQQALRAGSVRPTVTARLLYALEFVYLPAGKLPQEEHTARHVLRLTKEADLALAQNWAHWFLGVVYYEWNQLEAAVYHFSAVIANRHHAHLWAVQEAMCGLALAYQAQGLGKKAQETRDALLEWVRDQHNLPQLLTSYAFCGELALMQDEVESAQQWLELAGEQKQLGPMRFLEDPPITTARLLLANGDEESVARGKALLDELLQHVGAIHSTRKTIKVLALQACACELQGRMNEALAALERALDLGRPGGFIRTFADLPGLAPVLGELRKRRKADRAVDHKLGAYLQRILAAMSPMAAHTVSSDELLRREGLEPLTGRELHILRLLDRELTNKEIARELVVTPGTVKVHTNNLYRKLSVDNRRAAVTLAKALGLLIANQASRPRLI